MNRAWVYVIGVGVCLIAGASTMRSWDNAHKAQANIIRMTDTLRVVDVRWRHDTLVFSRTIKVPLALHDTVIKHLADTILVRTYIAASDSALHACSAVFQSCKASIAIRDSIIEQYRKLKPSRVSVGIGATCGYGFKGGDCTAGLTVNVRVW